jgi:hypothetical protein
MTLTLYDATTQPGTISIGGSATVTASVPGQDTELTFSGNSGQQISLVVSNNSISGGPVVTIYNPDGSQLASTQVWPSGGNFIDSTTLSQTGTYTIFVDAGSSTGSMTLTLYNTATQTGTISIGGSATVTSNAPGQDSKLTFSGNSGQQLSLLVTNNSISGGPVVTVYNPGGSQLASTQVWPTGGNFIDSTALPQTGTYTIFIDTGSSTGSMTITLYNAATQTGTITVNGSTVTASASVPGQDTSLTFSGTASQHITLSISSNTIGGGPQVTIRNPDGSQLAATTVWTQTGSIVASLGQTGAYTIFIDVGNATGSMNLTLTSP